VILIFRHSQSEADDDRDLGRRSANEIGSENESDEDGRRGAGPFVMRIGRSRSRSSLMETERAAANKQKGKSRNMAGSQDDLPIID